MTQLVCPYEDRRGFCSVVDGNIPCRCRYSGNESAACLRNEDRVSKGDYGGHQGDRPIMVKVSLANSEPENLLV
jgi:hypothetical protein